MKRSIKHAVFAATVALSCLFLAACSQSSQGSAALDEAGVAPYPLTEEETYLLECFGLSDTAQAISFRAPEGATELSVAVYRLEAGSWVPLLEGGINTEELADTELAGTFAVELEEDNAVSLHIRCAGMFAYRTDPIAPEADIQGRALCFLPEFQETAPGEEVPVMLAVSTGGTAMPALSVQDYFSPEKLSDMDLVQAVVLTFS